MPPLRLTDDELNALLAAAQPLDVDRRDDFLHAVVEEIERTYNGEIGPGTIYRAIKATQRSFWNPPIDRGVRAGRPSRWDPRVTTRPAVEG